MMRNFVCWVLLIISFCLSMYAGYFVVYKMQYAAGLLLSGLALAAWVVSYAAGDRR